MFTPQYTAGEHLIFVMKGNFHVRFCSRVGEVTLWLRLTYLPLEIAVMLLSAGTFYPWHLLPVLPVWIGNAFQKLLANRHIASALQYGRFL